MQKLRLKSERNALSCDWFKICKNLTNHIPSNQFLIIWLVRSEFRQSAQNCRIWLAELTESRNHENFRPIKSMHFTKTNTFWRQKVVFSIVKHFFFFMKLYEMCFDPICKHTCEVTPEKNEKRLTLRCPLTPGFLVIYLYWNLF